jgi:ArsR family transcriptional regulator
MECDLARLPVLDRLSALTDPTRGRILLVLERHELTVSELCSVLRLPQSTVSRHLKILGDAGWVHSRPEGTARLYRRDGDGTDAAAAALWSAVREPLLGLAAAEQDAHRLEAVLAQRRERSREYFASAAERWDAVRDELWGREPFLWSLPALLDPAWVVGDLGCGTGRVTEALAPFVGRVVAVDGSQEMLDAARRRTARLPNVELRRGELESLPIEDGALDAATMILVLHHVPDPGRALAEAARVLRPAGRLALVDMLPHDRQEYREQMGHVWLGFDRPSIERVAEAAGFDAVRFVALPVAPDATGPALFAFTGERAVRATSASRHARSPRSAGAGSGPPTTDSLTSTRRKEPK